MRNFWKKYLFYNRIKDVREKTGKKVKAKFCIYGSGSVERFSFSL